MVETCAVLTFLSLFYQPLSTATRHAACTVGTTLAPALHRDYPPYPTPFLVKHTHVCVLHSVSSVILVVPKPWIGCDVGLTVVVWCRQPQLSRFDIPRCVVDRWCVVAVCLLIFWSGPVQFAFTRRLLGASRRTTTTYLTTAALPDSFAGIPYAQQANWPRAMPLWGALRRDYHHA